MPPPFVSKRPKCTSSATSMSTGIKQTRRTYSPKESRGVRHAMDRTSKLKLKIFKNLTPPNPPPILHWRSMGGRVFEFQGRGKQFRKPGHQNARRTAWVVQNRGDAGTHRGSYFPWFSGPEPAVESLIRRGGIFWKTERMLANSPRRGPQTSNRS